MFVKFYLDGLEVEFRELNVVYNDKYKISQICEIFCSIHNFFVFLISLHYEIDLQVWNTEKRLPTAP